MAEHVVDRCYLHEKIFKKVIFLKYTAFLLAFALAPAAIASPNPKSRFRAAEPSGLPADWQQPLTLVKESAPVLTGPRLSRAATPAAPSGAPSEAEKTAALAKEAQNPIANLISLPFQNNTNFGVRPQGQPTQSVLNIQPVIPVPLRKDLLLVTYTIVPFIYQPTSAFSREREFGLGDINPSFFFSHERRATSPGESVPPLLCPKPHNRSPHAVFGALANKVWSFAGSMDRQSVNQLPIQPFFNVNFSKGSKLTSSQIITSNWQAQSGDVE